MNAEIRNRLDQDQLLEWVMRLPLFVKIILGIIFIIFATAVAGACTFAVFSL